MKKKPGTITITVDQQYFGTICCCALRYAMGRETYMPSLVRDFVRPLLPMLTDKTLGVMTMDSEEQRRIGLWGSETIDKPGWELWLSELHAEKARRERK